MKYEMADLLTHYCIEITDMIMTKYGFEQMTAFRKLLFSETYKMLEDPKLEMWDFSPRGIFDMWEVEQITGDPRNSLYIRRD